MLLQYKKYTISLIFFIIINKKVYNRIKIYIIKRTNYFLIYIVVSLLLRIRDIEIRGVRITMNPGEKSKISLSTKLFLNIS